jgi:hypothetical protein
MRYYNAFFAILLISAFIPFSAQAALTRPMKYYLVDRVRTNSDYATLSGWGINSAVVAIPTNGSTSSWQSVYNAAHAANVGIIIWPVDPQGDNNCGWESPFNSPQNGNYITKVTTMLDWWANKPGVLGIVTFHEPMWSTSAGCKDSVADLSAIYDQIHAYTQNPEFKIFGYINTLDTSTIKNGDGGGTGVGGYTGPADLAKIQDVAILWLHCAGNVEGPCEGGSGSALSRITSGRSTLSSVNSPVQLVFIIQTFTMGSSYGTKFTLSQLETYSADFINTNALDGFGYYTWDEGWYSGNLKKWTDLQPAVPYIYNLISGIPSPTSSPTPLPTHTPVPTLSPTPTVRPTNTPVPTSTPAPTVSPFPSTVPLVGDINGDHIVNILDFTLLSNTFGTASSSADLNKDGIVNILDFTLLSNNFGKTI